MVIRATWKRSVSKDVEFQRIQWTVNGTTIKEETLAPSEELRLSSQDGVAFEEGDVVGFTISADDGSLVSPPATTTIQIPNLAPQPVTELALEIV